MISSSESGKKTFYETLKAEFEESEAGKVMVNMTSTWKTNIILIFTGLILTFIFVWLMAECPRCLAMVGVAVTLLCFLGGGAACILSALSAPSGSEAYTPS